MMKLEYVENSGKICDYGCGGVAHYQFKNGKWCCENNSNRCPILKNKNSESKKGITKTKPIYDENSDHKCKYCREEAHYKFANGVWCCENQVHKCSVMRKKHSKAATGKSNPKPKYIENSDHKCKYCREEAHYKFANGVWCCENQWAKCSARKNEMHPKRKYIEDSDNICNWCGRKAYYQFQTGNWCCKDHWGKCATNKRINSKKQKYTLKDYQEKHPLLCKVEELREDPITGEIQVYCKNHNCENSKEKDGQFTPSKSQIGERIRQLESEDGNDGSYFYCSQKCKDACILFSLKSDPNKKSIPGYGIWKDEVFKINKEMLGCEQCEICGSIHKLITHHIYPQKTHPEMTLDPDNGLIVCHECHIKKCHPKGTLCSYSELAKLVCEKRYASGLKNYIQ